MWKPLDRVRRRLVRPRPRPVILMYHRVAMPRLDPWELAVDPDRFEQQLAVLRRTRQLFPMSEFAARLSDGNLPADAAAVTFDDGYADNLHAALPRLQTAGVPALLFLTTGMVGARAEYWWDELARLILLHRGTIDCEIVMPGGPYHLRLPECAPAGSMERASNQSADGRRNAYLDIWRRLRDVSATQRACVVEQLRERLDPPPADPADYPLTAEDVAVLARSGVFEIGCHTVTHAVLPSLSSEERTRELRDSRTTCEALAGRPIEGFAYPHGEHDAASRDAVRECGFSWACSTSGPPPTGAGTDRYAVSRLAARNWDGASFERILQDLVA